MSSAEWASYSAQGNALIKGDRALRADHHPGTVSSSTEVQAGKIVREIRALEADSVWAVNHPSFSHPFPGMEFLTGMCPMLDVGEI
jgi:adenosine deaminase CECR1